MTQAQRTPPGGLLRKVDCVQIPLADSDSELVLQTQRPQPEADFLVGSVDQASAQLTRAGGTVVVEPFDVPVGRVAVIADPFSGTRSRSWTSPRAATAPTPTAT